MTTLHITRRKASPAVRAEVAYILKRQKAGEQRRVKKPQIKLATVNVAAK